MLLASRPADTVIANLYSQLSTLKPGRDFRATRTSVLTFFPKVPARASGEPFYGGVGRASGDSTRVHRPACLRPLLLSG